MGAGAGQLQKANALRERAEELPARSSDVLNPNVSKQKKSSGKSERYLRSVVDTSADGFRAIDNDSKPIIGVRTAASGPWKFQ